MRTLLLFCLLLAGSGFAIAQTGGKSLTPSPAFTALPSQKVLTDLEAFGLDRDHELRR